MYGYNFFKLCHKQVSVRWSVYGAHQEETKISQESMQVDGVAYQITF